MMKSIATVCLSGTLPEKLEAIAAAGFKGVEIFENDLMVANISPSETRRMIADLGLTCTCYQPLRDFEGLQGTDRLRAFDRARHKFDLMNQLDAELLLICSSVSPKASGEFDRIVDDFSELAEIAKSANIRVGYEALAWGRHINDHRQAWDVVNAVSHPSFGLILDTFHSLVREIPISSLYGIDIEKLFLVQIADAPLVRMEYLYWSRHFRCFPGQGDLPVAEYVSTLVKRGYKGPLSHEIFNDRFRAWSSGQIANDGFRSLARLEDQISPRPKAANLPAKLPAPIDPAAVHFLEFAASGDEADELKKLFAQFGFRETGRHRTKTVSRWSQGRIDLVINEDVSGLAHAYERLHGASVCALGLGVASQTEAMARAAALGISPYQEQSAPGELKMSAVRAVGGTLIYFVPETLDETFWGVDFEPVEALSETSENAGLLLVDHIAQSMPAEEFLSWQLYYQALFDVKRTSPVDIIDPLGLVQSLAIESRNKALRITLNGAGGQTLASRFVANTLGSGVQHIAFSTSDIFAAAKTLVDNGVELLPLSDNYYEDLEAKFGLSPELLGRMKVLNIFYDEDEFGTYFQIYNRAFKKRVFFEVVQRDAYSGYGAPNAPVRLAAQTRFRIDEL